MQPITFSGKYGIFRKIIPMPARRILPLLFCLSILITNAQIKLPVLISNGMVLQRETPVKLWGHAAIGEKVTVKFNGRTYNGTSDNTGYWSVVLPAMKAGGPYTIDLEASNKIHLENILFGDVWFCSGQSNMVLNMERVKEKYPEEIATANYPEIRNFFIPTLADATKLHDDLPSGKWQEAGPKNVLEFGAAAYFFAKHLYQQYHIPIGIINSSVGGTPIEAWISEEGLSGFPDYLKTAARYKDTAYTNRLAAMAAANRPLPRKETDKGLTEPVKWFDTNYIPKGWRNMLVPGYWADQGIRGLNGVVWYRKTINLPASAAGMAAKLFMGRIVDADQVYVNGKLVGNITYQYPPRRYEIPAGLLKDGENLIVVRVVNTAGKGGFVPDKPYNLSIANQQIDLKGVWQYKVGDVFLPSENNNAVPIPSMQNQPTSLYNTMVAAATNYAVKGVLWYQGEANTNKAFEYRKLLPALIKDWRNKWKNPALPFLYVQLPGFMEMQYVPAESQWAVLRESQLQTLSEPNTAMAVAIDLGEWNDIHPLNKKDVGNRLALGARKLVYGENTLVASGPLYQSATTEGNKIRIQFTNTGSGLIAKDGEPLTYFAIAGADKKFVWAKATIENNTVVVWNELVSQPLYVRYAWADNPDGANLSNKEGLPASPFRTDQ